MEEVAGDEPYCEGARDDVQDDLEEYPPALSEDRPEAEVHSTIEDHHDQRERSDHPQDRDELLPGDDVQNGPKKDSYEDEKEEGRDARPLEEELATETEDYDRRSYREDDRCVSRVSSLLA